MSSTAGRQMGAVSKLRRRPTSEQVARRLWQMIFDGELRSGDRVPQDEIADQLGVSRIPVREALVSMAQDGMVVNRPHVGSFVAEFSPAVIRDHFEIYGRLQAMAAQRLVGDGHRSDLDEIARINETLQTTTAPEDVNELSTQLARLINVGSGSARLRGVLRVLGRMFPAELYPDLPASLEAQKRAAALISAAIATASEERIRAACVEAGALRAEALIEHLTSSGVFLAVDTDERTAR